MGGIKSNKYWSEFAYVQKSRKNDERYRKKYMMAQFAYVQESRKKTRQKQTPPNAPPASHGETRLSRKKKRRVDKQKNKENRQGLERRLRMTLVLQL